MTILAWSVFVLLVVLWTGAAWATAGVVQWAAAFIQSGAAADAGHALAQLPVPPWTAPWLDPQWVRAAQAAVLGSLDALRAGEHWAGIGLEWLSLLVWVVWAVGVLLILAITGGLLGLVRFAISRRHLPA